ncbi:MAG: DUF4870 domain-containing protein [Nanoarchaeota archaeon]|nr:DUF4870 domain-containing protein [Nanoarchaeota archaeon]
MDEVKTITKTTSNDNSILCIFTHLLGIFFGFLGALIIYLTTNEKDVKEHAKNALNWQLSLLIYVLLLIVIFIFSILLMITEQILAIVGGGFLIVIVIITAILLYTLDLIFSIIGAIKASENKFWEYPLSIKLLK